MITLLEKFNKNQLKTDLPDVRPGDIIRVQQKIKEGGKDLPAGRQGKIQVFEGLVIAKKHGKGVSSTITVRRVLQGIGVERIFPIHSPVIAKIEIVKKGKVRRSKLYYLRTAKGKRASLKREGFSQVLSEPATVETQQETAPENIEQK